jgi:ferric-dicitrate binding protein FerR (iron transport regulator)
MNNSSEKKYSDIVNSFFDNKHPQKIQKLFYDWLLSKRDGNQKEMALQQKFDSYDVPYTASVEEVLPKIHDKIGVIVAKTKTKYMSMYPARRLAMRIAAVLIPFILLAGGIFFYSNNRASVNPIEYISVYAPIDKMQMVILPCGSFAHINAGGKITYSKSNVGNREVQLSGETSFVVQRDEYRPFIVTTEHLQVTVLGTEFAVKESVDDHQTQITLEEGLIRVTLDNGEVFMLQPGGQLICDHLTGNAAISQLDAFDLRLASIWKEEQLLFDSLSLSQILRAIGVYCKKSVDFSAFTEIDDMFYSIRFAINESIETKLHVLKELTGSFDYRIEGKTVYIYN